jgi:putative ABC transport system permease protein
MGIRKDARFALRMAGRSPGFSALAVVILGLGVGASSAVFSLADAVLVDPLPFSQAERLVLLWTTDRTSGNGGAVSFPDFVDWRSESESFDAMAAFGNESLILGGEEGADRVLGELVTSDYFPALGVAASIGRTFSPDEGEPPSEERVALLGHDLFERRFGADRGILGRDIELNGQRFVVVGVLPDGFRGFSGNAELWIPMASFDAIHPELTRYDILGARGMRWHSVLGRLREPVELSEASAELDTIAAALEAAHPKSNENKIITLRSAYEETVSDHRASMGLLASAVGLLLLIACANLANLFLTRVVARREEVAVRMALGATRWHLARQILTESLLFGLLGGVFGLLFAHLLLALLMAFAPVPLPSYATPRLDPTVLLFTIGLSVVAGLLFGLVPARTSGDTSLVASLKKTTRDGLGRRSALSYLATAELALATLLLIGAGLLSKSLYHMYRFEPGFETENLLTMGFYLPPNLSSELEKSGVLERLADVVASIPGVDGATVSSHIYFGDGYMTGDLSVEGHVPLPGEKIETYRHFVGNDYLRTMGIPLLHGRSFDVGDDTEAPGVVVVNESFARQMWPNGDALGQRVMLGERRDDKEWLSVVGVVGDVSPRIRLSESTRLPQIYLPLEQGGTWSRSLLVRTSVEPMSLAPSVQRILHDLNSGIAVFNVAPMTELLARGRSASRSVSYLLGVFSSLALLLSAVGLYGVVSYAVGQSTHEIGLRLALGASRSSVVSFVMKDAMVIVVSGLTIGLSSALFVTRFITSQLYEVEPLDVLTFVGVALTTAVIVLAASYIPARRASAIDPVATLRRD